MRGSSIGIGFLCNGDLPRVSIVVVVLICRFNSNRLVGLAYLLSGPGYYRSHIRSSNLVEQ